LHQWLPRSGEWALNRSEQRRHLVPISKPDILPRHQSLQPDPRGKGAYNGASSREVQLARKQKTELLRGTLDLLILRVLQLEPLHGVAIADRIRQVTSGTFDIRAGTLFPALHRLEQDALVVGQWTTNESERRIKSYALTKAGRKQLSAERRQWDRVVTAIAQVLAS
jgi:PadR family transcriptional regulator PadR